MADLAVTGATGSHTDNQNISRVTIAADGHALPVPGGGWSYNHSAGTSGPDTVLTRAVRFQAGSVVYPVPVRTSGLRVTFDAQLSGGTGADWLAFALLNPARSGLTSVGGYGAQLGFGGLHGVAVALDAVAAPGFPAQNFVAVATGASKGALGVAARKPGPGDRPAADGHAHRQRRRDQVRRVLRHGGLAGRAADPAAARAVADRRPPCSPSPVAPAAALTCTWSGTWPSRPHDNRPGLLRPGSCLIRREAGRVGLRRGAIGVLVSRLRLEADAVLRLMGRDVRDQLVDLRLAVGRGAAGALGINERAEVPEHRISAPLGLGVIELDLAVAGRILRFL